MIFIFSPLTIQPENVIKFKKFFLEILSKWPWLDLWLELVNVCGNLIIQVVFSLQL